MNIIEGRLPHDKNTNQERSGSNKIVMHEKNGLTSPLDLIHKIPLPNGFQNLMDGLWSE